MCNIYIFNYSIVVQLQLSAVSPYPSTPPQPNPSPSPASTSPLVLSTCPLQQFLKTLLPTVLTLLPSAIVRLFLTSMSLVIFCLLVSSVDYIPLIGEIIWCLSLTAWLISLSIMLSSSIHAVAKGEDLKENEVLGSFE